MPKVSQATKRGSRNRSLTPAHASGQAKPPRNPNPTRFQANTSGDVREKVPHSATSSSPTHLSTSAAPSQPTAPVERIKAASITDSALWSSSDDETSSNGSEHLFDEMLSKGPDLSLKRQNTGRRNGVQLQILAQAYMETRREMWSVLAARIGEKWTVVEEKCMEKGLKGLTQAYRTSMKNRTGDPADMLPRVTDSAPTATSPQQNVELPPPKRFEDRYSRHFDRSNSIAARVSDTLKERLKYTVSTDNTVNDAARHKSRFMALQHTTNAKAPRHIP